MDYFPFLTIVYYAIHILYISLSTFTALWINMDKIQVGFTQNEKQIGFPGIYSCSFHKPNRKKPGSPPENDVLHRKMWISYLMLALKRPGKKRKINPGIPKKESFLAPLSIFPLQYPVFLRKSLSFLTLNRFSTICSNVLFPYFCPPSKAEPNH